MDRENQNRPGPTGPSTPADPTDRARLEAGVQQTDITESRVNEDFLEWLKRHGSTWLLAILVGLLGVLGYYRWREWGEAKRAQAWVALVESSESNLPVAFEDVAEEHGHVDGIGVLARLQAAALLMKAVQTGVPLDAAETNTAASMAPEHREQYLARAERLYNEVLEQDDGTIAWTLHAVAAIEGLAAVEESRGNVDAARELWLRAAERAEADYPALAEQARGRAESVDALAQPIDLPAVGAGGTAAAMGDSPFAGLTAARNPQQTPQRRNAPQPTLTVEPALAPLLGIGGSDTAAGPRPRAGTGLGTGLGPGAATPRRPAPTPTPGRTTPGRSAPGR